MIEQDVKILLNKQVASETYLMALDSPEVVAKARPGQFVMIRVRSGLDPLLRRPFSICGTRWEDQFLVLYRVVGKGTTILSGAKEGEKLSALGPLGRGFELPASGYESVLVAGGIGIAPLIFIAQSLENHDVTFLTGYRSGLEVVPMGELGLNSSITCVSTDDGTSGYQGYVTELLENHLAGSSKKKRTIFACGPVPMLQRVAALALDQKTPCQVSLEANMACGLGACQGCAVKASTQENRTYFHVCQDGPVFQAQSLDWKDLGKTL
jgi:dihydroorotate dehydrogenase electron transfer subunit